ncbi:MAG: putative toxin-antitoxin system toxin component, PIN family [Anaerolineales bacterium]|nr:putative toxin-antitoxin system toxin component, PIN family [Anaerolineales bacterium]
MKVVADTNTVISGLLWQGAPRYILDLAREGKITLCTSPALLAELRDVLQRKKFSARLKKVGTTARDLSLEYAALTKIIRPEPIRPVILADPDDDAVLACALSADAKVIVSGDSHLCNLGLFHKIPILTARKFFDFSNL